MDENKEIPESSEKMESPSEPASPVQSIEDEGTDSVSELNSPGQNNQEVKSPTGGLLRMLSFRRSKRSSTKDKASEDSGTLRGSKSFSLKSPKRNEEGNSAKNMTDTSADKSGENTEAESIKREPLSVTTPNYSGYCKGEMDENKEIPESSEKMESPSEPASPVQSIEDEGTDSVSELNSPGQNNQEVKSPTGGLLRMMSFRRSKRSSTKDKASEDSGTLRGSKSFSLKSPKRNEEGNSAKNMTDTSADKSGENTEAESIKREPLSATTTNYSGYCKGEMDENKEIPESSEKMESPSEPASPVQSIEDEGTDSVSELTSPGQNNQEVKSPTGGLLRMLSFRRSKRSSTKDKASEDSGTLRGSKSFSLKSPKRNEEGNSAKNMTDTSADKSGENTEAESIKREPLSVMEINELIQKKQLLEAFANIRFLEEEVITEREAKTYEDNPIAYAKKAKDVDLLYNSIANMIKSIVEETLDHPSINENLLTSVVTLISKEEKAHADEQGPASSDSDCVGRARKWRDVWKEAVRGSTKGRILKVPLLLKEDNDSWLALHLGFLRQYVLKDLLKIKNLVQKCYPDDYEVCDTYTEFFHDAISSHLQGLLQGHLEYNELYAVLDWVSTYYSETLLGHPDLKLEAKTENLPQLLSSEVRDKLQNDYIHSIKGKIKCYLDNILKLETTQMWEKENQPEILQIQYHSPLSLDIQMIIGQYTKAAGKISENLETATLEISVGELREFIPRFGKAFVEWDKEKDYSLFVPYLVAYINSFHDLMRGLRTTFKADTKELEKVLTDETMRFRKYVLKKLSEKMQPLFKKILTNAWMLSGEILDSIMSTAIQLCQHLKHLEPPANKDFLNDVHKYIVREYIAQVIKSRRKMTRAKREEVSRKMNQEATFINNALKDLGSEADWLLSAIHYIAKIISEQNKDEIKKHTEEMCQAYPDVRKEHIVAVFALRGLRRNKRNSIIQQIDKLQENTEIMLDRALFANIEAPTVVCGC